jgi:hypothetical protein
VWGRPQIGLTECEPRNRWLGLFIDTRRRLNLNRRVTTEKKTQPPAVLQCGWGFSLCIGVQPSLRRNASRW